MSKTMRSAVIVFTMLCSIVLVVFLIQLLVINRGNGELNVPGPPEYVSPPTAGTGTGGPSNSGQTRPDAGQDGENPDNTNQPDDDRPPPVGKKYSFEMPDDMLLIVYADDELFSLSESDSEDVIGIFKFEGSGTATLTISFVYMREGVEEYATSFLENDFGIEDAVVGEDEFIRSSPLRGVSVIGEDNGNTYEVWFYRFPDAPVEDTGLAFILFYQNDMHKYNLYDIVDSLDIIAG